MGAWPDQTIGARRLVESGGKLRVVVLKKLPGDTNNQRVFQMMLNLSSANVNT